MRRLLLLAAGVSASCALGGCNQIFGLDAATGDDDAPPLDARAGRHTFDTMTTVPIGLGPHAIAVADFDQDGAEDLAVTSFASSTVSVIGCPTRTCSVTALTAGTEPTAVVALDVDDSDTPDLAVVATGDQRVNLFNGNGDGTFDPPVALVDPLCNQAVAGYFAGGDEAIDLIVGDGVSSTVSVYGNNAAGSLALASTFTVPAAVELMVGGTLVADPATELVLSFSTQLQVFSFELGTVMPIGDALPGAFRAVAITDLDGDQRGDLITAGESKLGVWHGLGTGGFVAGDSFGIGEGDQVLAIGDLDSAGADDVVVIDADTGLVRLYLAGSAGLGEPTTLATDGDVTAAALADVDGDGLDDLVVVRGTESEVAIFFAGT